MFKANAIIYLIKSWKPDEFLGYVVWTFLSSNIPIYKANNIHFKFLLTLFGKPSPSESTLCAHASTIANIKKIVTLSWKDIASSQYHLIQKCQVSSASVEKSFLMLKKLFAKDSPFIIPTSIHISVYIIINRRILLIIE